MNILQKIIDVKRKEVEEMKARVSVSAMESSDGYQREILSLATFLQDPAKTGIIAEFKRKSPSKGIINDKADVAAVTKAYAENGASAISVLTDTGFFGGSMADLLAARVNEVPILRKDFIIDEYQIVEARSMGADVILLIAACLGVDEVRKLAKFAYSLGLEVLLELHGEDELAHVCEYTPIIGINNRNLKTFDVDVERSLRMASLLPGECIKVAESGIDNIEMMKLFRENGFSGFLIGEYFMKNEDPARAFKEFVEMLKS